MHCSTFYTKQSENILATIIAQKHFKSETSFFDSINFRFVALYIFVI